MKIPDVRFFTVVLTLQQEVGGNLAETLSNLSSLIRKRRLMRMKIHALTSEGRATGWVLGLLPLFVALAIHFSSPEFLKPLYTPAIHWILFLAVGLIATGVIIVRNMTNMEI
jgi:tight adherence protein B